MKIRKKTSRCPSRNWQPPASLHVCRLLHTSVAVPRMKSTRAGSIWKYSISLHGGHNIPYATKSCCQRNCHVVRDLVVQKPYVFICDPHSRLTSILSSFIIRFATMFDPLPLPHPSRSCCWGHSGANDNSGRGVRNGGHLLRFVVVLGWFCTQNTMLGD